MTAEPLTVTEDTPLEEIVEVMERRRIKRLPVLRSDKVIGIGANLLHALAGVAREVKPAAASDQAMVAELPGQPWAPVSLINVIVRDGIVEICDCAARPKFRAPGEMLGLVKNSTQPADRVRAAIARYASGMPPYAAGHWRGSRTPRSRMSSSTR
jgi:hypothetical protein